MDVGVALQATISFERLAKASSQMFLQPSADSLAWNASQRQILAYSEKMISMCSLLSVLFSTVPDAWLKDL